MVYTMWSNFSMPPERRQCQKQKMDGEKFVPPDYARGISSGKSRADLRFASARRFARRQETALI
jgi:hypothetical protein